MKNHEKAPQPTPIIYDDPDLQYTHEPVNMHDPNAMMEQVIDMTGGVYDEPEAPGEAPHLHLGSTDAINSEEFSGFNDRLDSFAEAYKSRQVPGDLLKNATSVVEAPRTELLKDASLARDEAYAYAEDSLRDAEALAAGTKSKAVSEADKSAYDFAMSKANLVYKNQTALTPEKAGSLHAMTHAEGIEKADVYVLNDRNRRIIDEAISQVNPDSIGDSLTLQQMKKIDFQKVKNEVLKIKDEAELRKFLKENPKLAEGLYLDRAEKDKNNGENIKRQVKKLASYVMDQLTKPRPVPSRPRPSVA